MKRRASKRNMGLPKNGNHSFGGLLVNRASTILRSMLGHPVYGNLQTVWWLRLQKLRLVEGLGLWD